jgi:hypothetical protein
VLIINQSDFFTADLVRDEHIDEFLKQDPIPRVDTLFLEYVTEEYQSSAVQRLEKAIDAKLLTYPPKIASEWRSRLHFGVDPVDPAEVVRPDADPEQTALGWVLPELMAFLPVSHGTFLTMPLMPNEM